MAPEWIYKDDTINIGIDYSAGPDVNCAVELRQETDGTWTVISVKYSSRESDE